MSGREKLNTILPLSLVGEALAQSVPVAVTYREEEPAVSGVARRGAEPEQEVGPAQGSSPEALGSLWPALIQSIPAAVMIVDEQRLIALANTAAGELLRDKPSEFVGEPVSSILSSRLIEEACSALRAQAGPYAFHDELQRADGAVPVRVQAELLAIHGRELLVLGIHDALSEARGVAELSDRDDVGVFSEERLHQAHRFETLGHLTSSLAHEFNNLLSVILGSVELAQRSLSSGDDPRPDLDRALIAASRSAETVRHILRYSRRRGIAPEVALVPDLVEELGGLIERTLPSGTRLVVECQATPPVEVSPSQLEAALLNLVINARDALEEDGQVTIRTRTRELDAEEAGLLGLLAGRYAAVEVEDDGVGMPRSVRHRAFEPFYTTKPTGQGTGLGLSTVRSFALKAGGAVHLESESGVGTSVQVLLPAAREPSDTD